MNLIRLWIQIRLLILKNPAIKLPDFQFRSVFEKCFDADAFLTIHEKITSNFTNNSSHFERKCGMIKQSTQFPVMVMRCTLHKKKKEELSCLWKLEETIHAGVEAEKYKNAMRHLMKNGNNEAERICSDQSWSDQTPEQIAKIKESCKINIAVLDYVEEHIKPGVSTEEIDRWVHEETVRHGESQHR